MDINSFMDTFQKAIENVKQEYYYVPTINNSDGIIRERVFCYELYHQLRCRLKCDFLKIHAELDKRGQADFNDETSAIPDFIIHQPGTHKNNNIIIEVKGGLCEGNILGDSHKIYSFIHTPVIHYKNGIFLLYNHSFDKLKKSLLPRINEIARNHDKKIYIICSKKEGDVEINTLQDLRNKS